MNIIGSLLGMVGLYKFFLDRSFLQMLSTAQRILDIVVSGEKNLLRPAERQQLWTDLSKALWDGESRQGREDAGLNHRFGNLVNELYLYFVPGPFRTLLYLPSYILTIPLHWVMDKKRVEEAREQTRQLAVKGLWSFFVPLGLAYTAAVMLVQEMDYVRVETDLDGVVSKNMVHRIVVGPRRFSLNLPHSLVLCVSFRLVIGFAVFIDGINDIAQNLLWQFLPAWKFVGGICTFQSCNHTSTFQGHIMSILEAFIMYNAAPKAPTPW